MSGKSIFSSSALTALAVALIATAIPGTAFAEPQRREERGGRAWGGGDDGQRGGGDYRARATGQGQVQAQAQVRSQPQQDQRSAPRAQNNSGWQGRGNAGDAQRWGSQDRGTTQRPGRDWQAGTVNRPATADRAGTPQTPQRGWDGNRWNPPQVDRNRDANRNGSWNGNRGENRVENRDRNWNGNRDQRGTWNGRNSTYTDRNRHDNNWRNDNNWRGNNNWRNDRRDGDRWRGNDRNDDRRWNNDWRRDNRYNWSNYRNSNRNHYRMPRYYAPYRDYNYSRLSIGFFLSSGFYGSSYWINDPWSYRLPPAYSGYRWVRYYDDVLLVDTYSGEVVDVIYNFFW